MKIEPISAGVPTPPPIQNDPKVGKPVSSPDSTTEKLSSPKAPYATEAETKLSDSQIQFSKIIGTNDQTQTLAKQIRQVDETMEQVGDNIHKMMNSLDGIIKVFPPYPKESSERVEALRQFSSFRKMIDQLTVPPQDDSPLIILGDHTTYPDAGDWEWDIGDDTSTQTIRHQPIHTGAGGLDIPDLSTDASDSDLHLAVERLNKAQERLEVKHQNFVTDANRIIKSII